MGLIRRGVKVEIYRPSQQSENGTSLLNTPFSSNGTGGGMTNMLVNAAGNPTRFWIQPPAGTVYYIKQLRFRLEFSIIANVNNWAGLTTHTVGELLEVQDENDIQIYNIAGRPMVNHARWIELASHWTLASSNNSWPNGNHNFFATIDFPELCGGHIRLDGDLSEKIAFILRDRCDQVATHRLVAHGWRENLRKPS